MNSPLETVSVRIPAVPAKQYDVIIGKNLINELVGCMRKDAHTSAVAIITDSQTKKLFGVALQKKLRTKGFVCHLFSFPAGEHHKTQATKTMLDHALLKSRLGRDSVIIALGGGVVGDMAGFVAATYLRGIPFIQVPTTLLAMIDSSIGGKTAIDTPYGKNMIGAFWQPWAVIIDTSFLDTLPRAQMVAGSMEAIKIFFTHDPASLPLVQEYFFGKRKGQHALVHRILHKALALKGGIVSRDEREEGERMVVNFGHTIGHALEKVSGYALPHGTAVGLGVLVEARIAYLLHQLSEKDFLFVREYLGQFGINEKMVQLYSPQKIIAATLHDKKARGGKARYVVLQAPGRVMIHNGEYAHEVDNAIVKKALYAR